MKKLFLKKVAASVVALLTLVSSGIVWTGSAAVSAADPQPITELKILKKLKLPAGVKTPTKTFSFNFKPYSFNNKPEEKNSLPNLGSATVEYNAADILEQNKTTINKDAKLDLTNINWGKPGQFTYEIEEAAITPANSTDYEEKWTKSPAKYLISFFVAKIGKETKVSKIFIKRTEPDANDGTDSPAQQAKVEYNPNPKTGEENGLKFTNIYNKKVKPIVPGGQNPPDETKQKKGLRIEKKAEGSDLFKAQIFEFKVHITKPDTVAADDDSKIKYFCTPESGNPTDNAYGDITFKLKNDQSGVFSNVWLGSKVTVEETDAQGGTTPVIDGKANKIKIEAGENTPFKTKEFILGEDKDGNYVLYKNKEQTATGVLLDNLPFILIALLAVIGIFFFFKNRKRKQDQAQHHF